MTAHLDATVAELRTAAVRLASRRRTRRRVMAAALVALVAAATTTVAIGRPLTSIVTLGDVILRPFEGGGSASGFPAYISCAPDLRTCSARTATGSAVPAHDVYALRTTATLALGSTNAILGLDSAGPAPIILCSRPENDVLDCRATPALPPSATADGIYSLLRTRP